MSVGTILVGEISASGQVLFGRINMIIESERNERVKEGDVMIEVLAHTCVRRLEHGSGVQRHLVPKKDYILYEKGTHRASFICTITDDFGGYEFSAVSVKNGIKHYWKPWDGNIVICKVS